MPGFSPIASFPVASVGGGSVGLLATARIQIKSRAVGIGAAGLAARAVLQIKARATKSSIIHLLGRVTTQIKARGGGTPIQALIGRITSMVKLGERGEPNTFHAYISATSSIQTKARAGALFGLPLLGRATIAVKARAAYSIAPLVLRGMIAIKTWLRATFQPHCDVFSVGAICPTGSSLGEIIGSFASIGFIGNPIVTSQAVMCCVCGPAPPSPPVTTDYRVTQASDTRLTMNGDTRNLLP